MNNQDKNDIILKAIKSPHIFWNVTKNVMFKRNLPVKEVVTKDFYDADIFPVFLPSEVMDIIVKEKRKLDKIYISKELRNVPMRIIKDYFVREHPLYFKDWYGIDEANPGGGNRNHLKIFDSKINKEKVITHFVKRINNKEHWMRTSFENCKEQLIKYIESEKKYKIEKDLKIFENFEKLNLKVGDFISQQTYVNKPSRFYRIMSISKTKVYFSQWMAGEGNMKNLLGYKVIRDYGDSFTKESTQHCIGVLKETFKKKDLNVKTFISKAGPKFNYFPMDEEFNFNNLRFTEKELEEHIEKNLLEEDHYFNTTVKQNFGL